MTKVSGTSVTHTQGDTFEADIVLTLEDGTEYTPASTDTIRFALKSDYKDAEPILTKAIPYNTMILSLTAAETKLIQARTRPYVYDIEVSNSSGVHTVVDRALWYSTEEVM